MKKLYRKLFNFFYPYLRGSQLYFIHNKKNISLHIPKKNNDTKDDKICKRIFESFKKMKINDIKKSDVSASSQWQKHIDKDFYPLKESLKENNFVKFKSFLNNFGNWSKYLGVEEQTLIQNYNKNFILRKYLKDHVFLNQLKLWNYFNANRKKISYLQTPKFGNQIGAIFENKYFTTLASFSNEIIASNLNDIIKSLNRPVVAELGAGYGQLAYFLLNKKKSCFIDIDIPETLCLAAYYLMKCFPNKKVFLYGENKLPENFTKKYDLVFLPSYLHKKLKKNSVDLFINKNSLGEMYPNTINAYFKSINKSTKYFFHMNHHIYRNQFDGVKKGLLSEEYPIRKDFKLVSKYPDFLHLIWIDGKLRLENDIFCYLYVKKNF